MNTSKRKQKAIRLGIAAVLALVLLVSVSVVLVIANTTPTVQADAMTVTLDGKVNLIFKFNDRKVNADTVSYTAVIGEGGREITGLQSVKVGDKNVVTVPLMPYEMAETVNLYQVDKNGANLAVSTGSVRGYANKVLEREDLEEYHNSVRALLNYGAMTQIDANANTSNLANADVFVRNNPIDIIKAVPFEELDATTGGLTGEISLVFSNNNGISDIALRYDINYEAGHDEELRAVINGAPEGVKLKEVATGVYRFEITNIGVNDFATVWNVEITAPNGETSTSHHSVLQYLDYLVKSSDKAEEKDVARSLYQLYQNTKNKLEKNCAHKNSGYYIPADENSSYLMCAACGNKIQETPINNNVTAYFSGAHLAAVDTEFGGTLNGDNGEYSYTFTSDGNLQHIWLREQYIVQPDGEPTAKLDDVSGKWANTSFDIGNAQYVVVRYKWSNRTSSTGIMLSLGSAEWTWDDAGYIGEDGNFVATGGVKNQDGIYSGAKFVAGDGSDYITYVISLDKFGDKVKAATDGSRIIDSMKIAINGKTGDVLNIDYIAFVEDWTECGDIIEDSTVQLVMSTDGKTVYEMKKDGTCVNHVSTETIEKGETSDTYKYTCTVCGSLLSSKVVPNVINKYLTAYNLVGPSSTKGATYKCTAAVADGNLKITSNDSTSEIQYIWLRENYYANAAAYGKGDPQGLSGQIKGMGADTTIDAGAANYIVVKVKSSVATTPMLRFSTTAYNYDKQADTKAWGQSGISNYISFKITSEMEGQWTVFAIDLESCGERVAELDGKRVFDTFMLTGLKGLKSTDSFEIQYIAFADNMDEVKALAGTDTLVTVKK